ncbi:MAG: sugar porter family MFS transporter [Steroidobacteraceae bacterium]|nr:sugar porter family MFS transporter [Steroidobacteraceae bacterium]
MVPGAPLRATGTILIVALSGFLMGFDGSLFTGAVIFIKAKFALSNFEMGWAVTSHTLTATLSIVAAGPLADRFGRRTVLRAAAVVFAVSAAVAAAASNFGELIVARLLSGLGVGAVLVAAPMYIAEIAPPAVRGRMVTFNQLFIVTGIFLAFSSNYTIVKLEDLGAGWLAALDLEQSNWRWMLGIGVVPAVVYLFALLFVPESPRWHAMHGRIDAARRILTRAHGETFAEAELVEVRASIERGAGKSDATLRDLLVPQLRGVLVIGLLVGILQQITGINSVFAYATVIFERAAGAGDVDDAAFMQTMLVGFVNLVSTVIALLLIDRVGRRPLLLYGTAGIALSLVLTAYGFSANDGAMNSGLVLAGLLGFVGCFAFSLGPGMWVLFSEIFPNRVRGLAISCVGFVNSSVCVVVQFMFPWQMATQGGTRTFLLYALFAGVGFVLLVKMLPETRGRSLEELEESLVRKS